MNTPFWPHQAKLGVRQTGSTSYYELFVIIDIYSRYVVAWIVAPAETGELAKEFIDAAITSQDIEAGQLTLHADQGTSMTSKPVAQLLVDLGVARSHSRPPRLQR